MPRLIGLPHLSLRWKLPLIVGGVSFGLGAALYTAAYLGVRRQAAHAAEERLSGVVSQLGDLLGRQGGAMSAALVAHTKVPEVRGYLRHPAPMKDAAAFAALARGEEADTSIKAMVLRNATGNLLASTGPLAIQLAALLDPRELPLGGKDTALVGRFRALDSLVFFPVVALVADSGRPLGYVTIWHRINQAPNARGPVAQLIGSDALLLMGSVGGAWISEAGPIDPPVTDSALLRDGLYRYDRKDEPVLAAMAAAPGTPWSVAVEFPARVITDPARRFVANTAPIGLLLLVLALALSWWVSRSLTHPLLQLTRAAEALGRGEMGARVGGTRGDEIGRLSQSFDRMAARVEREAQARAASEAQWRLLFDGSPHPKWVIDAATGEFLAVNPAATSVYGYTPAEFLDLRANDLEAGSTEGSGDDPRIHRHRTKEGQLLDVEVTEHPLEFEGRAATYVLAQNVTARTLLESRFRQAQKMQAIGRLAGGVAHDFNNFLTAIGAYAELLKEGFEPTDQRYKDVEEILRASAQATRLTRQLLAFSRQQVLQPSVLDVDSAVHAMTELLRRLVREDIGLELKLGSAHTRIRIDAGHLEQVLMNLVVNARDAMPTGGRLTITTGEVEVDEASAALHELTRPGRYATIYVSDTGSGMTAETKARLFEPFFTTKAAGHGTGLGLATVYGIVDQAGGYITVYSEPGLGSTFRVFLPVVGEEATVEPVTKSHSTDHRGHETILLVEDEAGVRNATLAALERQGYHVLPAPDAIDALAQVERFKGELHLVISDVVMPNMDGPTLIGRLRKVRPGMRALLMSGYAGDALPRIDGNGHHVPFIEKPFSVNALARKIREVLDG